MFFCITIAASKPNLVSSLWFFSRSAKRARERERDAFGWMQIHGYFLPNNSSSRLITCFVNAKEVRVSLWQAEIRQLEKCGKNESSLSRSIMRISLELNYKLELLEEEMQKAKGLNEYLWSHCIKYPHALSHAACNARIQQRVYAYEHSRQMKYPFFII